MELLRKAIGLTIVTLPLVGCQAPVASFVPDHLSQTREIRIEDDWNGLSPAAPVQAHYTLRRDTSEFRGEAIFSVDGRLVDGHGEAKPIKAVEQIAIPLNVAETFLHELAESPLEVGFYRPLIEHTDDYPEIAIELELAKGKVVFFTASQGVSHVPWKCTIRRMPLIVNSPIPAKAFSRLDPYLKREVLNRMIAEKMRTVP